MALHLLKDRGVVIEKQHFTWREISPPTISKLDCDAWTRVRIIWVFSRSGDGRLLS